MDHSDSEFSSEEQEQHNVSQVTNKKDGGENFIGQAYLDKQYPWYVDSLLDKKQTISFFVYTGADVSRFPYEMLPKEFINQLTSCDPVKAADNDKLDTLGKISRNSIKILNFPTKNVCLISESILNNREIEFVISERDLK
ncbi:unnamed protein product [Psylliodes chrysocephalus]|uniref:Uncharacterized protein n=1 Tax=Psylliodes chrysocephalus TaxID=3402493 RepID=A0A9P0CV79_9CUCU|nr:unnamed protein product [Psylliodes chrysocephala]